MDAFEPSTIIKAANDAMAWTQSVIDDVASFVPPGSESFVNKRSGDPRGWVQGAFLVGMKDWATTSENQTHWQYLKVRRLSIGSECTAHPMLWVSLTVNCVVQVLS
jgi:hypothetical protein